MCYPATKTTDSTALLQMMKSISSSNTPSQTNPPSAPASAQGATPSGTQPPAPKSSSEKGIPTETPYTSLKTTSSSIPICNPSLVTHNPIHIAITKSMLDCLFPKD